MATPGTVAHGRAGERVSVVMATFNGEEFLMEQLASIARQSRCPDDMIVVDDASTDATATILRDFADAAPFPVEVVVRSSHLGTSATFEEAMRRATGDILLICDQDDHWHPDKIATMVDRLQANPGALLAFSDSRLVGPTNRQIDRSRWRIAGFTPSEWRSMRDDAFGQMVFRQVVAGCTAAIRSDLLTAALPFPGALQEVAGPIIYDRWLSLVAAAAGPVVLVPEQLIDYRIHEGQQVGIPALRWRRVAPKAVLHLAQLVISTAERNRRNEYLDLHLAEIDKRLTLSGLATDASDRRLALAEEHVRRRIELTAERRNRIRRVIREFHHQDGYRRFSFGLATAVADALR